MRMFSFLYWLIRTLAWPTTVHRGQIGTNTHTYKVRLWPFRTMTYCVEFTTGKHCPESDVTCRGPQVVGFYFVCFEENSGNETIFFLIDLFLKTWESTCCSESSNFKQNHFIFKTYHQHVTFHRTLRLDVTFKELRKIKINFLVARDRASLSFIVLRMLVNGSQQRTKLNLSFC